LNSFTAIKVKKRNKKNKLHTEAKTLLTSNVTKSNAVIVLV
jgi:hypothetical protein